MQPIRKSKFHSFSKKDALQGASGGDTQTKAACQHTGGLVLSKLYTAKREQSFPKRCKEQKESFKAKEAHHGQVADF